MARFELELDAPDAQESGLRRQLTEVAVRIAEMFAARRAVIHLLYRVPGEPDSIVVPVGPLVQSLGERLFLALTQHDLEARTMLWLALPRGLHVAQVADPMAYDPEAPGEPDRLVADSDAVWALALARAHGAASYVVRAVLFVPEADAARVGALLEDFKARLATR